MILSFSTQLNGKPTYFVEKIHKGFRLQELNIKAAIDPAIHYTADYNFIAKDKLSHKIHTIRDDEKDRWQPGTKIDFFINCRQKNMFRFAPSITVVSVQLIEIVYYTDREVLLNDLPPKKRVAIDGNILKEAEILQLAQNDGFDTVEEFFEYFNEDFTGKLIHWTDKKY